MAVGKVTISSIAKLDGWMWDTHVTGFGARRQTNGVFYYVRYRHGGQQTVRSIGRHGPWTPDTARAKALQLLGEVAGGGDPFAQGRASQQRSTVTLPASGPRSSLPPSPKLNAICGCAVHPSTG
jgi:hypothetical protein